jgi:K+ transporter
MAAGTEAMFADLGHFTVKSMQVIYSQISQFSEIDYGLTYVVRGLDVLFINSSAHAIYAAWAAD